jgi:hypothetical protein
MAGAALHLPFNGEGRPVRVAAPPVLKSPVSPLHPVGFADSASPSRGEVAHDAVN